VTRSKNQPGATAQFAGSRLRRGVAGDVAQLVALEREVFELEQLTARAFRRYLARPEADVFVATVGDTLVGYVIASYRRGAGEGRVISIAVATVATARGLGTALMSRLHAAAASRGIAGMRLEVRRTNQAAINLYTRIGYSAAGIKPAYYADFCDAIVMRRMLGE
jgi:ribosomal-protein-alanine N-acetyltransferase